MEEYKQQGQNTRATTKEQGLLDRDAASHRLAVQQQQIDQYNKNIQNNLDQGTLELDKQRLQATIQKNMADFYQRGETNELEWREQAMVNLKEAGLENDPGFLTISSFISNSDWNRPTPVHYDPETQDTQGEAAIFSKMSPGDVQYYVRPKQTYTKEQAEKAGRGIKEGDIVIKEGDIVNDKAGNYAGWQRIQIYVKNRDGSTASYGTAATPGLTHND